MITSYGRGPVTLRAEWAVGADTVTLTLTRTAPLTDDDIRRLNRELADYGCELIPDPDNAGCWLVQVGEVLLEVGNTAGDLEDVIWQARR